jgi:hypothetical protein
MVANPDFKQIQIRIHQKIGIRMEIQISDSNQEFGFRIKTGFQISNPD